MAKAKPHMLLNPSSKRAANKFAKDAAVYVKIHGKSRESARKALAAIGIYDRHGNLTKPYR